MLFRSIDCDEVLCLLMQDFIQYMNQRFNIGMKYEDLKEYDLNKYFGLDRPDRADVFIDYCKEHPKHLRLVPGAKEALMTLSEKYRLIIITGRVIDHWRDATEYWVNHNLHGVPIEKFIYANDRGNGNEVSKEKPVKARICEEEGISVFIDDREKYVLECVNSCEKCILFGDYPWTYKGIKDERVVYCKDWDAVLKELM